MESAIPMADIHGAVEVYEWLVESSAKYGPDAVVLGGTGSQVAGSGAARRGTKDHARWSGS